MGQTFAIIVAAARHQDLFVRIAGVVLAASRPARCPLTFLASGNVQVDGYCCQHIAIE